jgi:hypothetical protein
MKVEEVRERGFYWVLVKSGWREVSSEWDLGYFDGRGRWVRCTTGLWMDPRGIEEVGARVKREGRVN